MRYAIILLGLVGVDAAAEARGASRGERAVAAATSSIARYAAEEAALGDAAIIAPSQLLAHWRRLAQIRAALARLPAPRDWDERSRVELRHALAQLLGQEVLVDSVRGSAEKIIGAAARRRRAELTAIARWSHRHLDFAVALAAAN